MDDNYAFRMKSFVTHTTESSPIVEHHDILLEDCNDTEFYQSIMSVRNV